MSGGETPIVLTGPTGWIGTAMLALIAATRGSGWSEGVRLFGSSARNVVAPDGGTLPVRRLDDLRPADVDGAIVVHLSFLTKEKADLLGERRFTDMNFAIDDAVLSACAGATPRGVFVASSGAAVLAADGRDRHPYGMSKLRQEDRFLDWSQGAGVPVLAGRIWSLAGPFMNKTGSYALGDMIGQARQTGRIRISARTPVFRSYLHVFDLCMLVLGTLRDGVGRPAPIDLCGGEVLEMGDLADRVATRMNLPSAAIERPPVDFSYGNRYFGDFSDTKTLSMALSSPIAGFDRQLSDTCDWMMTEQYDVGKRGF